MARRVSVESTVRVLITAGVGLIGAAAGFTHTHDAAVRAGQSGWLAWADAVVIECMVIVAALQLARERKEGKTGRLPMVVLVVAFLIQMGAQVSGAPMTFAGWLFAAVPALGCLVVVKFAFRAAGDKPKFQPEPKQGPPPVTAVSSWGPESVPADPWPEITSSVAEPEPRPEVPTVAVPEQPEPVAAAPVWPPR